MKAHRSSSKSGLFLIEMIIAIVFFAITSAICTQLFVHAHLTSQKSRDMAAAATIGQNMAEEFKLNSELYQRQLDAGEMGTTIEQFFDGQGYQLGIEAESEAAYRLVTVYREENGLLTASFSVFRTDAAHGDPLCFIRAGSYTGQDQPL